MSVITIGAGLIFLIIFLSILRKHRQGVALELFEKALGIIGIVVVLIIWVFGEVAIAWKIAVSIVLIALLVLVELWSRGGKEEGSPFERLTVHYSQKDVTIYIARHPYYIVYDKKARAVPPEVKHLVASGRIRGMTHPSKEALFEYLVRYRRERSVYEQYYSKDCEIHWQAYDKSHDYPREEGAEIGNDGCYKGKLNTWQWLAGFL